MYVWEVMMSGVQWVGSPLLPPPPPQKIIIIIIMLIDVGYGRRIDE